MAAPWFKLYPKQFLTDSKVKMLTREHRSILLDLWCYCSEDGSIPADLDDLSRLIGEPRSVTQKAMTKLAAFFVPDGERLVSVRMRAEAEAYEVKCQKLRDNGTKGGRPSKPDDKPDGLANGLANGYPDGLADGNQMALEVGSGKLEKALPPTPLPPAAGKPKREPKVRTLGAWPDELDLAMDVWRDLRRELLSEEILAKFPNDPDGKYVAQVGTKGKAWEAWQKRRSMPIRNGGKVTDDHILAAVKLWSESKYRNATTGRTLSMPNLSSLINSADFEDALLRVVEMANAS